MKERIACRRVLSWVTDGTQWRSSSSRGFVREAGGEERIWVLFRSSRSRVLRASVLLWRPSEREVAAVSSSAFAFSNRGGTFCCVGRTAGRLPVRPERLPVRTPISIASADPLQVRFLSAKELLSNRQSALHLFSGTVRMRLLNGTRDRLIRLHSVRDTWNAHLSRTWLRTNFFSLVPEWELLIHRNCLWIYFLYRQISLLL